MAFIDFLLVRWSQDTQRRLSDENCLNPARQLICLPIALPPPGAVQMTGRSFPGESNRWELSLVLQKLTARGDSRRRRVKVG